MSEALGDKGRATRQRILDAATAEFARHGAAGARVDRIAAEAAINKAQIYTYFGSKERLFDAVLHESMNYFIDIVPIGDGDLVDWALRLYDEYLVRPELVRIATWTRLERRPTGPLADDSHELETVKIQAIVDRQAAGSIVPGEPFDIMALVLAMSLAWSPSSNVYTASADEPAADHERRRALLADAVRRAFTL